MPRPDEKLESNQRWLKRLARRMARSPASADDLVQETYLTALSKPPPDGPMRPWLLGVMRRLAWGEVRSGQRRAQREECFQLAGPSAVEPDPFLAHGIDRARLRSIVEGLPEPFRSTVEQRFLEGLSCVEIARAAGVPAGTIRWRQSRALELLRTELERPPRRRARRGLVWLPLVGLERAAAVGRRVFGVSVRGRSGVALLGVALVAALVALAGRDVPAGRGPTAEGATRGVPAASRSAAVPGLPGLEVSGQATPASASPGRADGDQIARLAEHRLVSGAGDPRSRSRSSLIGLGAAADRRALDLYDCTDVDGELHCVRQLVTADEASGPVCVIIGRSLGALDRARSAVPATRSTRQATFLRAARLANLFLAAELDCALTQEPEREKQRGGGGARRSPEPEPELELEPSCQTEEDESGRSCTTCTDERGVTTTACAPVECETATREDGAPCTTCTDSDGHVESDCEVEPDVCGSSRLDVDVFADEILPILAGEIDLNDTDTGGGSTSGCTRGACHGTARPDGFYLDPGDTLPNNLERFACSVDLEQPELSQILVCATGDERCAVHPHPGAPPFSGPDDLNYQRILAFVIQASALQ